MRLGIVGYGPFTKTMIKYLQHDFEILVSSRNPETKSKEDLKFDFASTNEVLALDTVILSIPAQFFEEFITEHKSEFNPNGLVIDVASIKQAPIKVMEDLLPPTTKILGTHPLFGPGSAKDSLKELQMVICPVRGLDDMALGKIYDYLESKNLIVLTKTPEEHDNEIAYVLGLTHLIGQAVKRMNLPDLELTTPSYAKLLDMREIQGKHSWDLFKSIESTTQAKQVIGEFKQQIDSLLEKLEQE